MIYRICFPLSALALAACAGNVGGFPSLAPRPVEQAGAAAETAVAPAPTDPILTARAAALVTRAERGETAMETAADGACGAITRGRGAREGGEAWVAAQQALSAVETARADTVAAREEIDALVLDQARLAQDGSRPVDLTPLLSAADRIAALDTAQEGRLQAMREGRCAA